MTKTRIEWADTVWNPVTGCTPVSPGCAHCYARTMARRLAGRCGYPADEPFRVTLHPERLSEPLRWTKPRRVFVCSMGDLFHDDVDEKFIAKVWAIMDLARQHTFMVLTKRPERALKLLTDEDFQFHVGWFQSQAVREFGLPQPKEIGPMPLRNCWAGVTAEDQQRANERIPILLQIPAAVRFVSVEPMLEAVDLSSVPINYGEGFFGDPFRPYPILRSGRNRTYNTLDWVICGCETGPGARPMEVNWVRDLRDQCQEAGVPFFLKALRVDGKVVKLPELDGRKWDQVPKGGNTQCQS